MYYYTTTTCSTAPKPHVPLPRYPTYHCPAIPRTTASLSHVPLPQNHTKHWTATSHRILNFNMWFFSFFFVRPLGQGYIYNWSWCWLHVHSYFHFLISKGWESSGGVLVDSLWSGEQLNASLKLFRAPDHSLTQSKSLKSALKSNYS